MISLASIRVRVPSLQVLTGSQQGTHRWLKYAKHAASPRTQPLYLAHRAFLHRQVLAQWQALHWVVVVAQGQGRAVAGPRAGAPSSQAGVPGPEGVGEAG